MKLKHLFIGLLTFGNSFLVCYAQQSGFSVAEQEQISIPTPHLFSHSNVLTIDFSTYSNQDYSFPLPIGKATLQNNQALEITTRKGDAVRAMFAGVVRLARKTSKYGNVIVVRHDNGLETVYAYNLQNVVKVGQRVKAGQTLAIVGGKDNRFFCLFAIMINGGWLNPSIFVEVNSHKLSKRAFSFKRFGNHVDIIPSSSSSNGSLLQESSDKTSNSPKELTLDPEETSDPFLNSMTFKLDLEGIQKEHWAYPLPGSHVISSYGGKRNHSGVDIKTKPNDIILAAFDGLVIKSSPFSGYGNCIVIKHAYGFETLYSHQSKNLVKVGQKVKAGQVIGLTGRTGRATTEHLHFEVHFKGRTINPATIFNHVSRRLQAFTLILSKSGNVKTLKK